jgi:hypothetical protein
MYTVYAGPTVAAQVGEMLPDVSFLILVIGQLSLSYHPLRAPLLEGGLLQKRAAADGHQQ